eukprot:scaffold221701_cov30-Tisochrysis_lutea.AAC.3
MEWHGSTIQGMAQRFMLMQATQPTNGCSHMAAITLRSSEIQGEMMLKTWEKRYGALMHATCPTISG